MSSSQINEIKANITAKEAGLVAIKDARSYYLKNLDYQIAKYEQDIYELNVRLQLAEADATFYTAEKEDGEEDEGWNSGLAARQTATLTPHADGGDELCEDCNGYVATCDCDAREAAGRALVGEARAPCGFCDGCVGSCGCGAEDLREAQEELCYHCGHEVHSCLCPSAPMQQEAEDTFEAGQQLHDIWGGEERDLSAAAPPFCPPEGTKLKWVSSSNPETYRVAVVKKNGILEVKNMEDSVALCHDTFTCICVPCSEINLSRRLGVPMPPWRPRRPLVKTLFETGADWCRSLPVGGVLTITEPQLSDRALKKLCMKPLFMLTDGGRLEELEKRFPGATMVLTTDKEQLEIVSMNDREINQYRIYCENRDEIRQKFADFGGTPGKPNLMAEWKGLYIDLTHLF